MKYSIRSLYVFQPPHTQFDQIKSVEISRVQTRPQSLLEYKFLIFPAKEENGQEGAPIPYPRTQKQVEWYVGKINPSSVHPASPSHALESSAKAQLTPHSGVAATYSASDPPGWT